MKDEKLSSLSKISVLAGLTSHDLLELESDFRWESFPTGSIIIEQG